MAWKRKPTRLMPVTVDPKKGTVRQVVALNDQNPPKNSWDQWLKKGGLCRAKNPFFKTGRETEGVTQVWMGYPTTAKTPEAIIHVGDLVTYIGRLVMDGKYTTDYQFLTPRYGIVIADPAGFEDAREDVNETQTE